MNRDELINAYFEWMYDLVCGKRFSKQVTYRKLLMFLHDTEFRWSIPKDSNRAGDGVSLRWRFVSGLGYSSRENDILLAELEGPCSVLEMMIALAIRCEENIMFDPEFGDRTGQWFWGMIVNLGLGSMNDKKFNKDFAQNVVDRFLDREYEPDGRGGLFTVNHYNGDLREIEIWYQLHSYIGTIA